MGYRMKLLVEMQFYASKCLRLIVIIGNGDKENDLPISNWYLRYNSNIGTMKSPKMRDEIRDIYIWNTCLRPAYLNNIDECGNRLNRWIILRGWVGGNNE